MRKRVLSILLAAVLICQFGVWTAEASFSDIFDPNVAQAAAVLQGMGIVDGVAEGKYAPDTVLTRAQFCALLVRMMGMEDQVSSVTRKMLFSDAKPGMWYTGYVNLAYDEGLVSGYGNGKFGPNDAVSYGQVATMLLRLLGYTAAEVGNVWPGDYVNYAGQLGLNEGVSANADTAITRGQAAVLLFNTLQTEKNGTAEKYYLSAAGTRSALRVIMLDAATGGQMKVCVIGNSGTSVEYYLREDRLAGVQAGSMGDLLLGDNDTAVGFVPATDKVADVVISEARTTGITDPAGTVHAVAGSAVTIVGDAMYVWKENGCLYLDGQRGTTARLYYNDRGVVTHVYLSAGVTAADTKTVMAQTASPAAELAGKLGAGKAYSITKNGAPAEEDDLAQYDIAYFDDISQTLRVSDYQITGYIEAASPNVNGAETITIAGCTISVLESAWDSLHGLVPGNRVTLLLTDDGKAALATTNQKIEKDMLGVLSTDGSSATLCGSDLVVSVRSVENNGTLLGTIVNLRDSLDGMVASAPSSLTASALDIQTRTMGNYELAPSCQIYEHASSGTQSANVYSLAGEKGTASADFEEIFWTDTLPASAVTLYHLNSAGKVDVLLLNDVTGNCYQYGKLTQYSGDDGIRIGSGGSMTSVGNHAVTVTNGNHPAGTNKYLCGSYSAQYGAYTGIALRNYSKTYQQVSSIVTLNVVSGLNRDAFVLQGESWYALVEGNRVPVNGDVQIYLKDAECWLSGEENLPSVLSADYALTAQYDRTLLTGAQIRVIVAEKENG